MAGAGSASVLKPSAILLLLSGSLILTAIVLTVAPRTVTTSEERLELVELGLDAGDLVLVEVECSADDIAVELSLIGESQGRSESVRRVSLSQTDQGFDGSIAADGEGRHKVVIEFQGLEGEAQVKYSVKGRLFSVWIVALMIAVPSGIWGAWLKQSEGNEEASS